MFNQENLTEIIIALISLLTLIAGGAWLSIKKSKRNTSKQENINITGDGNKIIGRDDNSTTKTTK